MSLSAGYYSLSPPARERGKLLFRKREGLARIEVSLFRVEGRCVFARFYLSSTAPEF